MHWTDKLHAILMGVSDLTNRIDIDARLLAASNVKLDRALLPLLSRLALHEQMSTVELANLVGRDHSTVSRQLAKLEDLALIERVPSSGDRRVRMICPSAKGKALLGAVAKVRRQWIEAHFRDWPREDIDQLISLAGKMMEGLDEVSLGGIEMIETRSA